MPTAPTDTNEVPVENLQVNNRRMMDQILDSSDGEVKFASSAGTNMIRRRIREEGFTRNIIPPAPVTNDDLDRVVEHDRPVIIEDMEPLSKGAKSISFGDTADTEFYYGGGAAFVTATEIKTLNTSEWLRQLTS